MLGIAATMPLAVPYNFGEETNLHGVREFTSKDNNKIRRAVWLVFVLVCLGVLINNTTRQVLKFLTYEHVTKFDILFTHSLDFPAVTVCNVNRNRRSAFTLWDIVEMGPHLGMTDENFTLLHEEQYPQDWVNSTFVSRDWEAVKTANAGNEFDWAEFDNRTGHQFEDMIQHCTWQAQQCNETDWEVDFTHYGKCYSFNTDGSQILHKAGSGNGLRVILNVEHDEYLSTDNSEDLGVKFLPHATVEPPFLKELGFGLAPGYHYFIALQQRDITGLPLPYGDCEADHTTTYFDNYTVPGCRIECETQLIYEKCGCRLVESPGSYPVCRIDQYDCAEQALLSIEKSDTCLCENPCHTVQYPFRISLLELRESTLDLLRKEHPIPAHLSVKDLLVLNVYFDSLAYEVIEQVPAYTILDILSDFGGTMGLWLGASILAAIQIIEFLLLFCHINCGKKKRPSAAVQPQISDKPQVSDKPNSNGSV